MLTMISGADALSDAVARLGCRRIWALGASRIEGVLSAARRHQGLSVLGASTECDAVFAANGDSRLNGVGVAAFIGSVGLTNAAAGLQTITEEGQPVLLLVGQTDHTTPTPAFQDTRIADAALLQAIGCPAWRVRSNQDLACAWPQVLEQLQQSRPAALLIDESALRAPWTAPALPTIRPTVTWPAMGSVADPVSQLTRAGIWAALGRAAPGAHAFADAGQVRQAAQSNATPLRIHHCPRTASLGWAVPAAMGACRTARTFAVCGDGGFLMSLAAVASLGHHGLPVTVVIAHNGILGVDAARGPEVPHDLRVPAVDYVNFARSVGVEASRADHPDDIVELCARVGGPRLIVAEVPAFENIPVTL